MWAEKTARHQTSHVDLSKGAILVKSDLTYTVQVANLQDFVSYDAIILKYLAMMDPVQKA